MFENINCYIDASLTNIRSIYEKDEVFINFDNLRVKRVNRTEYHIIGEFNVFVELGNDYQVCADQNIIMKTLIISYTISSLKDGCIRNPEILIRKQLIMWDRTNFVITYR